MQTFTFTINDELGIHARPAGVLVKEAKNFESEIFFIKGDARADVRKIFSLMKLGAKKGESICVEITGPDEELACKAFQELVQAQL